MKKVIVIGTGILGASATYKLAKKGVQVIAVDRHDTGQATDAGAGIICPWIAQRRNQAWYQLAKGGARYYPQLIEELHNDGETETGYKRVGTLKLLTDEDKMKETEKRLLKRRQDAPEIGEITILNEKETQAKFPILNENYRSIHVSGGARVNGKELRDALIRGAKKHGAEIIHGDAQLVRTSNKVTGVSVAGETYHADIVIAASGAWLNDLLTPLDSRLNVYPQRGQIIHLQMPNMDTSHLPVVMQPKNQYLLTFPNGRIVIGATRESDAGFDYRVTADGINEILSQALDIFPGLANSTVLETKVGFRPYTKGSLPVIGRLPHFEGIILANGLGASGLTTGPYIGNELAKLALGEATEIDLNNYDVANMLA